MIHSSFQRYNWDQGQNTLLKGWGYENPKIPIWQRWALKVVYPLLKRSLAIALNINPEGAADGLTKAKKFFKETDAILADGRQFIMGSEELTHVDVALAACSAILLMPPEYTGYPFRETDYNPSYRQDIKDFSVTTTGKYVARMFKNHRF